MPRSLPDWTVVDFIHTGPWWKNRGILWLNVCLMLPLLTSSANGLDSSLINGLQILPDWQFFFHYPRGRMLGVINSAQSIGGLAGLPFTPYASDLLGRRAALFLGSLIMLAGVALQISAWSVAVFICARVLIGFGLTFCLNAAPLLLIELGLPDPARQNHVALQLLIGILGSIISAWICFGSSYSTVSGDNWSWRAPTLVQAAIPLLQVTLVWFIPESPRFLMSKGYEAKAAKILNKFHANGATEPHPLVQFELAQIRHALRLQEDIDRGTSYWSLFTTPGNRKRMRIIIGIAVFSQWSGNGLVSYYINLVLEGVGITGTHTKATINAGLQIFNLAIAVMASFLVDYMGRRTLLSSQIPGSIFNTMHKPAAARATIPIIFLFYFFYDLAYTPMLVAYTLEILPYKIRAKGFAVMNLVVFLTSAFNQFVNPWAIDAIGWYYYLAYLAWLAIELAFIYFYIVETKGRTLEETAILFDGAGRQEDLAHMGGEAATTHLSRANAVELEDRSSTEEKGSEPTTEGSYKPRNSMASVMTTESGMNWLRREEVI
ncbi:general substrate transporter [Mycena filopes]|nr:general substrate transporter [Mycena filopes]